MGTTLSFDDLVVRPLSFAVTCRDAASPNTGTPTSDTRKTDVSISATSDSPPDTPSLVGPVNNSAVDESSSPDPSVYSVYSLEEGSIVPLWLCPELMLNLL